jgi:hypothetical protein
MKRMARQGGMNQKETVDDDNTRKT